MAPAASVLGREAGTKRQRIERLIQRGDLLANAQQERQTDAPSGSRTSSSRKASSSQVFNAKRSSWTPQEDAKLCKLVQQLGGCNWSEIATHFPARDRKRCRERFVNHLAPSLAASRGWSAADDEKLLQLQRTLRSQWSKVARQFAGRSAESVKNRCLLLARRAGDRRPSSDSRNRAPAQRWTAAEKDKLRTLVETHGAKNWLFIASQLPGRTDLQCLQQWHRTLDSKVLKGKGTWTEREDRLLVEKVEEVGRNWAQIAAFLPGRVGSQCRERFLNHLDPTINSAPWTAAEEAILTEAVEKYSTQWGLIAEKLPGRSGNAVKNHWYSRERRRMLDAASSSVQSSSLHSSSITCNLPHTGGTHPVSS